MTRKNLYTNWQSIGSGSCLSRSTKLCLPGRDYTVDRHSNILDTQGQEVELEELLVNMVEEDYMEVEATQETASETEEPVVLEIDYAGRPSREKSV